MRDTCVGSRAEICYQRATSFRGIVGIEQLDTFVARAGEELSVLGPAHSLDDVLVGLSVPYFFSTGQIPDLYHTVSTSTCESLQGPRVLGHCVDSINMTSSKLSYERSGEHALDFGGIEGSSILPRSFEWMKSRVEISGLVGYT